MNDNLPVKHTEENNLPAEPPADNDLPAVIQTPLRKRFHRHNDWTQTAQHRESILDAMNRQHAISVNQMRIVRIVTYALIVGALLAATLFDDFPYTMGIAALAIFVIGTFLTIAGGSITVFAAGVAFALLLCLVMTHYYAIHTWSAEKYFQCAFAYVATIILLSLDYLLLVNCLGYAASHFFPYGVKGSE